MINEKERLLHESRLRSEQLERALAEERAELSCQLIEERTASQELLRANSEASRAHHSRLEHQLQTLRTQLAEELEKIGQLLVEMETVIDKENALTTSL